MRKVLFFFMVITAGALLLSLDQSMGADDMVVAVDKSTLLKALGLVMVGILTEIRYSVRSLFKITSGQSKEISEIKGYCEGRRVVAQREVKREP